MTSRERADDLIIPRVGKQAQQSEGRSRWQNRILGGDVGTLGAFAARGEVGRGPLYETGAESQDLQNERGKLRYLEEELQGTVEKVSSCVLRLCRHSTMRSLGLRRE
jgi:hypothetical protein